MARHDEVLATLRRLHDAVLRHGLINDEDGDDERWLAAFQELMAAMGAARDLMIREDAPGTAQEGVGTTNACRTG